MNTIKNNYFLPKTYTNSIGIEFVLIPPGTFLMGSYWDFNDEKPVHRVTISKPFFIGKYPVTQKQWKQIMEYNPSYFKGDNLPVETINWYETQEFINKLNQKEKTNKYRLPTEAEWEYSCRSKTKTRYFFGNNSDLLDLYAWYKHNAPNCTQPVGQKRPNPWGLYDMYGNVWEWCQDWYKNKYSKTANKNPKGPRYGQTKISRGGSWGCHLRYIYSAYRTSLAPGEAANNTGFRLVKTL